MIDDESGDDDRDESRSGSHRARTTGPLLARNWLPVTFRCGQRAAARVPTWQKRRVRPALNGPAPACHQRPSTRFTQLGQHYFLYYRFFIYCSTVVCSGIILRLITRYGYERVTLRWQLRSNHYWRWPSPI